MDSDTGLTTLSITAAGLVYVNVFDADPSSGSSAAPNSFVLRVGKGNYAQMYLNDHLTLAASAADTVTLTWSAVTGAHVVQSEGPSSVDLPPPRYLPSC
jgi:hypothetical protein